MKNTIKAISLLILIAAIFVSFKDKETGSDYVKQWNKVDSYKQKGLPKSAIEIVDKIYKTAKQENNSAQIVKSLIYRISLNSSFEEDYMVKSIATFKNELSNASFPEKQILQSLLAQLYNSYYLNNRWQINQRQTLQSVDNDDIKTWDALAFNKVISNYYTSSIENEKALEDISLTEYSSILIQSDSSSILLWPTLYDLLANRALTYFSSGDAQFLQIAPDNKVDSYDYFASAEDFVKLKIDPKISATNVTLNLFQKLLAFHIHENNIEALVSLDLKRLQYVYNNSSENEKSKDLYLVALNKLSNKYSDNPAYLKIAYKLANQYFTYAGNYNSHIAVSNKNYFVVADSICNVALKKFPDVAGSNNFRNLHEQINTIDFDVDAENAVMPNTPILSLIKFKNINKLYFKIVIANPKANANRNNRKAQLFKELDGKEVVAWQQELPRTTDHRMHSVEVEIPKLDAGYYIIFVSNDSLFSTSKIIKFKPLWVSSIAYITSLNKLEGNVNLYTVNRKTGKVMPNVDITIYQRKYDNRTRDYEIKKSGKIVTDKHGYAKIEAVNSSNYGTFSFMFSKGNEELFSENYLNFNPYKTNDKPSVKTFLFTDRAVYRPGQTVYFKAVVIEQKGKDVSIVSNYNTDVELLNTSRKQLSKTNFVTNNSGSFNGSFIIPMGELNGQMTIRCSTGRATFLVEEYKLPTFEISFDSLAGQPKLNQKVTVTGKAQSYSGANVGNAKVNYRVVRNIIFPSPYYYGNRGWYPPDFNRDTEIASGTTTTSPDGTFDFDFDALSDDRLSSNINYNYKISVEVTDITGEVQTNNTSISIGSESVFLAFDIPKVIDLKNLNNHNISATNIAGLPTNFNATISVYKLLSPQTLLVKRFWDKPDFYAISESDYKHDFPHAIYKNEDDKSTWNRSLVSEKTMSIDGKATIAQSLLHISTPGEYLIVAAGIDDSGKSVESKLFFTVYSSSSKKLPGNMINWAVISKNSAEPGDIIKLVIGSAAKKTRVMYEVANGYEIIERNWVSVSKGQKIIDIPVKEEYRGNFSINVTMVRFNRMYTKKFTVIVPFTNKKLNIKLVTFRDFITPGATENWTVTISCDTGMAMSANLLAGMYDAALDIFGANTWKMNLYKNKRQLTSWESNQFRASTSSGLSLPNQPYFIVKTIQFPSINWFGYRINANGYPIGEAMNGGYRQSSMPSEISNYKNGDITLAVVDDDAEQEDNVEIAEEKAAKPIIPLRNNFNETAFFYPNLVTDSLGNISFSFKSPDALTRWKIMLMAYTNDLKVGTFESEIKSKKDLMIMPNVPRFIRQGDTLVFTAKVINFTDNEMVTTSEIKFYDGVTMRPLNILIDNDNKVISTIKSKQDKSVSWQINIPDNITMLAYKITSTAGLSSDGEERLIPVLTNRKLVTSTMPMNVNPLSTTNFTFDDLNRFAEKSSTISNYKYTIEFTSNPTWYAIQALPYLSTPVNKSNISLFNSYYANSLSAFIVASNPGIKSIFESWKMLSPDAFLSNLEKNKELKNKVLASTPWVLEAESETEQKRRIGLLFDVNNMSNQKEAALTKLIDTQLVSGAWPWFKGMREDRHTTQTIVLGMAKLHSKGVLDISSNRKRFAMIEKAVRWLDEKIVSDYAKLKKQHPGTMDKYHIYSSQVQYIYLRALLLDVIPIPKNTNEAFQYYLNQSKKYWLKQSNYLQGMIAISLDKFGYRNESEAIVRSLKERSIFNKEMGMYWRYNNGWNWYQAPVETQAMMIETMYELDNNSTIINQLKVWLLKQKQTQRWNTSSATAEAVFALLMYGDNNLDNNKLVDILIDGKQIDIAKNADIEPGTGYFSTSWDGSEITKGFADVTVKNPNNNMAWGAAYWQYFEDLDKIKSHSSPLSVTKKMYVEKQTDNGPVLVAIELNQKLNVGDKVISRLIITTDRDMDYVQLTDMRASAFEPANQLSGYGYSGGLWYYKNITDVGVDFFINHLKKGTYVIEYPIFVTQKGNFSNGIATIQSMYAPEFAAHSSGNRIIINK